MIQLDNLITSLKLEVMNEENKFTEAQRTELNNLLNSIQSDKIPEVNGLATIKNSLQVMKFMGSMKKVSKQLGKFEEKWIEYGGDVEKLKSIAKQTEDMMMGMIKSMVGV